MIRDLLTFGAAGGGTTKLRQANGNDPESLQPTEEEGSEIFDIRPMTVGLVKRGANRRSFFLAKSDTSSGDPPGGTGGTSMPNDLDLTDQEAEELDAVLTEIEQARGKKPKEQDKEDLKDKGVDEPQEEMQKGFLEKISDALSIIANRRTRDPILAAQRALGTIGGHPELMDCAKMLMDFLDNARKKGGKGGEAYPNPEYGYPAPAAGDKPPLKKEEAAELAAEPGQFSVAEKTAIEGAPMTTPTPAAAPPETPPLEMQIKAALDAALGPIQAALDQERTAREALQVQLAKSDQQAKLVRLAKSSDIPMEMLELLNKGLPEAEFTKLTDQLSLWRRLAKSGGMFSELGTSAGGEPASDEVILQKRAEEIAGAQHISLGDAVIEASKLLAMGLPRPRELGREE